MSEPLLEGILNYFGMAGRGDPRWVRILGIVVWVLLLAFLIWMVVLFGFIK